MAMLSAMESLLSDALLRAHSCPDLHLPPPPRPAPCLLASRHLRREERGRHDRPPRDINMPFANVTTLESASMDIWNSGASGSTVPPHTEGNCDDPRMENAYTASLSGNRGDALRIGGGQSEPVTTLSLGSPSIEIGGRQSEPVTTLSLGSPSIEIWNSGAPVSSQLPHTEVNRDETNMETGGGISMGIWNSGAPISSQLPHTEVNCDETNTETGGGILRIGGRRSEPVDTLCFGSASIVLNNHHIDVWQPSQSFTSNDLPQNFDSNVGHVGTSNEVQEVGSSHTGLLSSGGSYNTRGNSSRGFENYSGNTEGRSGGSSDGRRASKRKLNEGVSGQESALGSSSFSHQSEINTTVDSGPSHQNPSSSSNISRPSDFLSGLQPTDQLNLKTRTTTGVVATGSSSGTVAGSAVTPSLGTTTASQQNPALRYHRSFPEAIRQSSFTASSAAYQVANVASQPLTQSDMPLNTGRPSAVRLQERPQAPWKRDDVPAIPVSMQGFATASEGRSRLITEDIHLFDHLDRHRDMRLNIDNMSYEELLALGERIGNVSTGLNEETIDKCLKKLPHVPIKDEALEEIEPCCICQEEYVEGDELGKLDCGHGFHAVCIKQWLLQKNLCPICKTTALESAGK